MRAKGIGAAGVGAVVGAVLGFHATSGLIALITTIIGAAVVSNLSLLVLDIWTERAVSRGTAAPVVDLSETETTATVNQMREPLPDLVIVPAHDPGAADRLAKADG